MSILKIHRSDMLEAEKNVFSYVNTMLLQNGGYVPSWDFSDTSGLPMTVYLETLSETALLNQTIEVLTSEDITTGGYTVTYDSDREEYYAAKQSQKLEGIHRLKLVTLTDNFYSEIFKEAE